MFATLELPIRDDSRHKRLQGGRACHPCRMKKIKCDGKQPCMQCKARRRKCMFVKNADDSYIRLDASLATVNDTSTMDITDNEGRQSQASDDRLFTTGHSETYQGGALGQQRQRQPHVTELSSRTERLVEQLAEGLTRLTLQRSNDKSVTSSSSSPPVTETKASVSSTSKSSSSSSSALKLSMLDSNITPWLSYGAFVRWTPELYPPATYSVLLDMPNRAVQEQLIDGFFSRCHHLLPIISRRLFYDHLETKGPLITPLLLNIIYAHAAKSDPLWTHQSKTFYLRARQLVDDFLDTPRMSSVVALLYMAAFDDGTRSSRCWIYSGMAVRMAMALGLYKANYYSNEMSQFDVELRKRVLWASYVMDQLYSTLVERPPMLTMKTISLDLPTPLPEDTDQERFAVAALTHLCRLIMILEKVVEFFTTQYSAARHQTGQMWSAVSVDDEQQIVAFLNDIKSWHDRLPHSLTWYDDFLGNDSSNSGNNDGSLPMHQHQYSYQGQHQHWAVVNLHLLAFILELSLLLCCRYPMITERGHYLVRSISQLVSWTIHHAHLRISMTFSAFSGLLCASTLLLYGVPGLDTHDDNSDRHGMMNKVIFRQCLMDVRHCLQYIPVHDIQRFSHLVDAVLSSPPSMSSAATTAPLSGDVSFGTSSMDATMAAAAAAVVTATGVMGDDHDLDLLSSSSPPHVNIFSPHQEQHSYAVKTKSYSSMLVPMYDKSPNHTLSHVLPNTVPSLMKPSSASILATSSSHLQQLGSSSTSSQSSFGLPPITSTASSSSSGSLSKPFLQQQPINHHQQLANQHQHHTIEPADYTFELISVADEWARSLTYETHRFNTNTNNNNNNKTNGNNNSNSSSSH